MAKKRTVAKTKDADGGKIKVVTRKMKDGNTKVKSKTKSGGVVTKRKVTVGPKKTTRKDVWNLMPIGDRRSGAKVISGSTKKTTQSVKGKETVKNRNAKKGEARKTKSKIGGTRSTTTRTAEVLGKRYNGPSGVYAPKYTSVDGRPEKAGYHYSKNSKPQTTKSTTPAKRTPVKTKIKKRGRK